jgi:hypothetical protein
MARPRNYNELSEPHQILPAVPTRDFGEGIGADDEIGLLAELADAFHGVYRVAFSLTGFQARRDEAWIHLAGQFRHAEAILIRGAGVGGFVRRMGGWNKPDLFESELIRGFARHSEMGVMDGVESAAE